MTEFWSPLFVKNCYINHFIKDTMVPAKVKLGQAVLDLNLPAWLVVRLRLSSTVANPGTFFIFTPTS